MKTVRRSIGREAAIKLGETKWWKGLPAREIVAVQLFTQEMCVPFDVFMEALTQALDRPVFTHELASSSYDDIVQEFLRLKPAPTFEEICNLIPADKRIIVEIPI